jgi:hypothetical protein
MICFNYTLPKSNAHSLLTPNNLRIIGNRLLIVLSTVVYSLANSTNAPANLASSSVVNKNSGTVSFLKCSPSLLTDLKDSPLLTKRIHNNVLFIIFIF